MAEWLRRWTRNPMGSPRAGSNPARSVSLVSSFCSRCFLIPETVCCLEEASSKLQKSSKKNSARLHVMKLLVRLSGYNCVEG